MEFLGRLEGGRLVCIFSIGLFYFNGPNIVCGEVSLRRRSIWKTLGNRAECAFDARLILAKDEMILGSEKPIFSLEEFETGVVSVSPGWLKEVWNKWPGDETIEELLAALDEGNKA